MAVELVKYIWLNGCALTHVGEIPNSYETNSLYQKCSSPPRWDLP